MSPFKVLAFVYVARVLRLLAMFLTWLAEQLLNWAQSLLERCKPQGLEA